MVNAARSFSQLLWEWVICTIVAVLVVQLPSFFYQHTCSGSNCWPYVGVLTVYSIISLFVYSAIAVLASRLLNFGKSKRARVIKDKVCELLTAGLVECSDIAFSYAIYYFVTQLESDVGNSVRSYIERQETISPSHPLPPRPKPNHGKPPAPARNGHFHHFRPGDSSDHVPRPHINPHGVTRDDPFAVTATIVAVDLAIALVTTLVVVVLIKWSKRHAGRLEGATGDNDCDDDEGNDDGDATETNDDVSVPNGDSPPRTKAKVVQMKEVPTAFARPSTQVSMPQHDASGSNDDSNTGSNDDSNNDSDQDQRAKVLKTGQGSIATTTPATEDGDGDEEDDSKMTVRDEFWLNFCYMVQGSFFVTLGYVWDHFFSQLIFRQLESQDGSAATLVTFLRFVRTALWFIIFPPIALFCWRRVTEIDAYEQSWSECILEVIGKAVVATLSYSLTLSMYGLCLYWLTDMYNDTVGVLAMFGYAFVLTVLLIMLVRSRWWHELCTKKDTGNNAFQEFWELEMAWLVSYGIWYPQGYVLNMLPGTGNWLVMSIAIVLVLAIAVVLTSLWLAARFYKEKLKERVAKRRERRRRRRQHGPLHEVLLNVHVPSDTDDAKSV